MMPLGQICLPDGEEPSEWIDVRRERERIRRALVRMRRQSRMVDRRQYRGNVQRRRWR